MSSPHLGCGPTQREVVGGRNETWGGDKVWSKSYSKSPVGEVTRGHPRSKVGVGRRLVGPIPKGGSGLLQCALLSSDTRSVHAPVLSFVSLVLRGHVPPACRDHPPISVLSHVGRRATPRTNDATDPAPRLSHDASCNTYFSGTQYSPVSPARRAELAAPGRTCGSKSMSSPAHSSRNGAAILSKESSE